MNPDTTKIIDRLVLSRDGLRKLDIADYAMIREAREVMADAANALTNYAKTFAVIEQNDQAAAPHMLSAPEGVSEAEKRVRYRINNPSAWEAYEEELSEDLRAVLSALSSERERAERAERERDEARGVVRDTLWMARRYADGRQSYAVGMYNDAAKIAEAGGYAKGEPDGTLYALDGLRPEYQTLETRAQAAEAKVKELLGLLAPFLPINAVDTRDYAELSFGDHQTQAMTMQPDDWIALSTAALRWTETQGENGQ